MTEGRVRTHATMVRLVTRTTQAEFTLLPSAHQLGKPFLMDIPFAVRGKAVNCAATGLQKRADLVEEAKV